MFLTVHAAAGILIGQQIHNPIIAFLVGLLSHFIVDMVPHGDEELKTWLKHGNSKKRIRNVILMDFTLALTISIFFINQITVSHVYSMITAIIGSTIPDFLYLVWHPWKIFKKPSKKIFVRFTKLHSNIQEIFKKNVSFKYALAFQLLALVLLFFLIL